MKSKILNMILIFIDMVYQKNKKKLLKKINKRMTQKKQITMKIKIKHFKNHKTLIMSNQKIIKFIYKFSNVSIMPMSIAISLQKSQ